MLSMSTPLRHLRRALLAQDCVLCGAASADTLVCGACAAELPAMEATCPQCGDTSLDDYLCGRCIAHPPAFETTIAVWRYEFPLDRLVQALKYGHRLAFAAWFGEALAARVGNREVDLVVPLPLHRRRLRERGFNQAMEIARRIAPRVGARLAPEAMVRLIDTAAQTNLSNAERQRNVRNAFTATSRLTGLRVALVDDVMTTGATLDAAARALKGAGAIHIENWVVARAASGEPL